MTTYNSSRRVIHKEEVMMEEEGGKGGAIIFEEYNRLYVTERDNKEYTHVELIDISKSK